MREVSREEFQKRILEKLAELEHEQWCAWATTMLQNEPNISSERRSRWLPLISKPYRQLSEHEKEQDRVWARRVLEILEGDRAQFEQSLKELQKALDARPSHKWMIRNLDKIEDVEICFLKLEKLFSGFQGSFFKKEPSVRKEKKK